MSVVVRSNRTDLDLKYAWRKKFNDITQLRDGNFIIQNLHGMVTIIDVTESEKPLSLHDRTFFRECFNEKADKRGASAESKHSPVRW